ncbi:DUF397 domain-containing protein [Streptomyces sp. NPDC058221]|uniref:DUF397 domain-containing protein n=1 Tax=Streptomyces sp. NPDC058221 TaxID=3346388 RepID=UPI0036E5F5E5
MTDKPTAGDAAELAWFKSSYSSSGDGNDCVEVAATPGAVRVRDSKNPPGPMLAFGPQAWAGFTSYVAGG